MFPDLSNRTLLLLQYYKNKIVVINVNYPLSLVWGTASKALLQELRLSVEKAHKCLIEGKHGLL